tara:strand:+ start:429 stop:1379 length:951 start_codon:yes stop_codon:yes gene_type:complete
MLYTIKKSFATHEIQRGLHSLYFEEYGTPSGIPVIFLHGGPGSGCSESQKALFNNSKYRVIFLDQRGAGRSKPYRFLKDNKTYLLIEDIEAIRTYLDIKRWLVVGGSWGATLAIAYAERFPDSVKRIVIRALFLGTKKEIEWAFLEAPRIFKPKLLNELNNLIKNDYNISPIYKLGEMLESNNSSLQSLGSRLWQAFEASLASINSENYDFKNLKKNQNFDTAEDLPNTPFLEWHYIKNNFFLEDEELIKNKKILKNIPITIIQGGYDLLCPPNTSYQFIDGLNKAEIINVSAAGHYITDPGIKNKLREAIDGNKY